MEFNFHKVSTDKTVYLFHYLDVQSMFQVAKGYTQAEFVAAFTLSAKSLSEISQSCFAISLLSACS